MILTEIFQNFTKKTKHFAKISVILSLTKVFARPLAPDGRHGNGPLRGLHSLCSAAEPEGFDPAPNGPPHLRRFLGVLLIVHIQRQRHGESGHEARGQPRGTRRAEAAPGGRGQGGAETEPAREIGFPEHTQQRAF